MHENAGSGPGVADLPMPENAGTGPGAADLPIPENAGTGPGVADRLAPSENPDTAAGVADPFAVPPLVPAETAEPAGGESTAAALLAAGRKIFAEHGYDGASVRAITAAADANLGAITYHFGSKKALYNRVVELCVSPLVARVESALSGRGPVLDRLENVVRAYFDHFAENPDLPHLMLQEVVLAGAPPEAAAPFMRRIYALIVAAIREGQATGELRPGDPTLMGMSLIGQPIFPMLVRQPVEAITGLDLTDPRTRERVIAHVMAFARAGFAGPNANGPHGGGASSAASASNGTTRENATVESTPAASTRRVSAEAAGSAEEAP